MKKSAFVLLCLLASSATAAELEDQAQIRRITEQTMKTVVAGDLRGGLELARPYVVVPPAEFDALIGQAELQFPMMTARFGKPVGYELLYEKEVGQSLLKVVYLYRFERHATVWNFYFYRGSGGWVLNSFHFDDEIRALF